MEDQPWKGPFLPQQGPYQPQCAAYLQQGPASSPGVTKDDLNEIKLELKEIGVTLRQLAVQDERIQANRRDLDQAKVDIHDIYVKMNALRSDHDKCGINSVQNNMEWIKWLVVLIIASLLGITFALVKEHMAPEKGSNGTSAKQQRQEQLFDPSIDQDIVCDGVVEHGNVVRLSHQIHDTAGWDNIQGGGRGGIILPDHGRAVDTLGVRWDMRGAERHGEDAAIILCSVPESIRRGLSYPRNRTVRSTKLPGTQKRRERAGHGSSVQRPMPDHPAPIGDLPGAGPDRGE